jgi:hypothetical protein
MTGLLIAVLPMSLAVQGTATGTVYDSLARAPLGNAVVQLVSLGDSGVRFTTRSDGEGRFAFEGVPPGRFAAGFSHPAIDSMGLERSALELEIREGRQEIRLATPSPATIYRSVCREAPRGRTATLLFGHVLRASDGAPLPGATVVIARTGTAIVGESVVRRDVTDATDVGENGAFFICGPPENTSLQIRAAALGDTSGSIPMRLAANTVRHVTLSVGRAERVVLRLAPSPDLPEGASVSVWRGPSRLRGMVRNPVGAPMAGVRVQVVGTGRTTMTNEQGTWALDSLPEGTQVLEVRAIGYEPMRPIVHLRGETPLDADITMLYRAVTLDEVVVRGSYERNLELFEQRRRTSASGYFLRPEEVLRHPPQAPMAQLIQMMPQTLVNCRSPYQCIVTMFKGTSRQATDPRANSRNSSSREQCVPSLYIDGILQQVPDYNFLNVGQIAAVEVYPRANFRPLEFLDMHNDCGSVVFWTRLRGPPRP